MSLNDVFFYPRSQGRCAEWQEIELVDGEKLAAFAVEKGLGVKETPVTYLELDEEFFTQFS